MFKGAEVGIVQHRVGIDNTHHADLVEVQTLADHLCTNQNIRSSRREVADNAFIGIPGTCGVQVHTGYAGLRKEFMHLLLYLLRTVTATTQIGRAATRTFCRYLVGITTIMTCQLVQLAVVGQRDVTVLTGGHPATLTTLHNGGKAATVLEQDDLFTTFQGFAHPCQQQGRERTMHHLAVLQVGSIYYLYLW